MKHSRRNQQSRIPFTNISTQFSAISMNFHEYQYSFHNKQRHRIIISRSNAGVDFHIQSFKNKQYNFINLTTTVFNISNFCAELCERPLMCMRMLASRNFKR